MLFDLANASLCITMIRLHCRRCFRRCCCCFQVEKVMRSKVLHLQQQVDELNAKQVELLQQKQALQVRLATAHMHQ
jgi:hypothetical protein